MIESKKGKLKEIKLYTEKDLDTNAESHYLRLVYEYKDDNGNLHEVIIPKLSLSFFEGSIPAINEELSDLFGIGCGIPRGCYIDVRSLEIERSTVKTTDENGNKVIFNDVYFVDIIKKRAVKKMTLEEIEKKLGYKYDTFLEKCLEPYGISKGNAYQYTDRIRIEEESPHIEGFETITYQRFYIDNKYAFTVAFKQKPVNEGGFVTGMITTYEKVVEQDRLPKEEPMTNKKAAEILEMVRGMSANSDEEEAFAKAIEALEEQDKYKWIFGELPDPEWNKIFEEVEKALGFKLFHWQKTYVVGVGFRQWGSTTACILRDLLWDAEESPIVYTVPASSKTERFYRAELLKIKEKLDKAGIKTREVLHWSG